MANNKKRSTADVTRIKPKKKNNVLRVLVLIVASALLIGIIIMPLQAAAEETEGVSIVVEDFETGKLSDAINKALDGTDFNHVTNLAVLKGTLSASDYQALLNIPNLENIELAGTETENGVIPENAIPSRNQLRYISLPKNTKEIGAKAFNNNKKLVKISMPATVEKIGDYAFEACEALESFPVNEKITYIGAGAFKDCKAITEFVIPSNITEIYAYTFSKCGFSEIIIGPSVTAIGDGAFADCNNLKDIYVYAENAPSIANSGVFQNVGASIHVYEDSVESFKAWEGNNIKAAGDLTGDYPVVTEAPAAETTAAETEAAETTAEETEAAEADEVKEETEAAEKADEASEETEKAEPVQAEPEEKGGVSVAAVIIVAVVGVAVGFVGAMLVNKKK